MDPVAALEALDRAMFIDKDIGDVAHYSGVLVEWLKKGGYSPVGPHNADWRGKLTAGELLSHFRAIQTVAEIV